jgi:hypothetical protein
MKRGLYCFALVNTLVGTLAAQIGPARYNFDFGSTGVFPLSGFRTYGYSAGPGWRGGSEIRLIKCVGAEAGVTEAWPVGIVPFQARGAVGTMVPINQTRARTGCAQLCTSDVVEQPLGLVRNLSTKLP